MVNTPEHEALQLVAARLATLIGAEECEAHFDPDSGNLEYDGLLRVGPFTFLLEWKSPGHLSQVVKALKQVKNRPPAIANAIPLVAVPYMGEAGRKQCDDANVAWLDLSGNARILIPGLRIQIEGKPNTFKRRGRPSSAFAPKSSRIARWLLMHPGGSITQREIARKTGSGEGYTSRIVSRLERDGLIIREQSGAIKARDPDLLLEAWREVYDFSKHHIIRGHIAARSGEDLLWRLSNSLKAQSVDFAATGLAAAWLLDRYAGFRTAAIYLTRIPPSELFESLTFREDERGANTWFVIPNDEGIFHGSVEIDGTRAVHPVQIYLDLGGHPERADEAAEKLRTEHLTWRSNA